MNTKSETQQAALYRCTDKRTHEVFYTCKSDTTDEWYQVRYNERTLSWSCTCPATKPCKHERAVQEVLKIRRQAKQAPGKAERQEKPLAGASRGFSMSR